MEAEDFIGWEGKLGPARIIFKSSREFFKGYFVEDIEYSPQKIQSLLPGHMAL